MSHINSFFSSLNSNISRAKTKKALRTLDRKGKNFIKKVPKDHSKIKANQEYTRSRRLIENRLNHLQRK